MVVTTRSKSLPGRCALYVCSKCPTPIDTFRPVPVQAQLNLELEVPINTTQSVFSGICLTR